MLKAVSSGQAVVHSMFGFIANFSSEYRFTLNYTQALPTMLVVGVKEAFLRVDNI